MGRLGCMSCRKTLFFFRLILICCTRTSAHISNRARILCILSTKCQRVTLMLIVRVAGRLIELTELLSNAQLLIKFRIQQWQINYIIKADLRLPTSPNFQGGKKELASPICCISGQRRPKGRLTFWEGPISCGDLIILLTRKPLTTSICMLCVSAIHW